jgi:putative tricarboxylic transport membrane protein
MTVFVTRPISATFVACSALLILLQVFFWVLGMLKKRAENQNLRAEREADKTGKNAAHENALIEER